MLCVQVLRQHGVRVLTVRDILAYNVAENISARVDLEAMAFIAMTYTMELGTKVGVFLEQYAVVSSGNSPSVRLRNFCLFLRFLVEFCELST